MFELLVLIGIIYAGARGVESVAGTADRRHDTREAEKTVAKIAASAPKDGSSAKKPPGPAEPGGTFSSSAPRSAAIGGKAAVPLAVLTETSSTMWKAIGEGYRERWPEIRQEHRQKMAERAAKRKADKEAAGAKKKEEAAKKTAEEALAKAGPPPSFPPKPTEPPKTDPPAAADTPDPDETADGPEKKAEAARKEAEDARERAATDKVLAAQKAEREAKEREAAAEKRAREAETRARTPQERTVTGSKLTTLAACPFCNGTEFVKDPDAFDDEDDVVCARCRATLGQMAQEHYRLEEQREQRQRMGETAERPRHLSAVPDPAQNGDHMSSLNTLIPEVRTLDGLMNALTLTKAMCEMRSEEAIAIAADDKQLSNRLDQLETELAAIEVDAETRAEIDSLRESIHTQSQAAATYGGAAKDAGDFAVAAAGAAYKSHGGIAEAVQSSPIDKAAQAGYYNR